MRRLRRAPGDGRAGAGGGGGRCGSSCGGAAGARRGGGVEGRRRRKVEAVVVDVGVAAVLLGVAAGPRYAAFRLVPAALFGPGARLRWLRLLAPYCAVLHGGVGRNGVLLARSRSNCVVSGPVAGRRGLLFHGRSSSGGQIGAATACRQLCYIEWLRSEPAAVRGCTRLRILRCGCSCTAAAARCRLVVPQQQLVQRRRGTCGACSSARVLLASSTGATRQRHCSVLEIPEQVADGSTAAGRRC